MPFNPLSADSWANRYANPQNGQPSTAAQAKLHDSNYQVKMDMNQNSHVIARRLAASGLPPTEAPAPNSSDKTFAVGKSEGIYRKDSFVPSESPDWTPPSSRMVRGAAGR